MTRTIEKTSERERQRRKQAAVAMIGARFKSRTPANWTRQTSLPGRSAQVFDNLLRPYLLAAVHDDSAAMVEAIVHAAQLRRRLRTSPGPGAKANRSSRCSSRCGWSSIASCGCPIIVGKNQKRLENELGNLKLELSTTSYSWPTSLKSATRCRAGRLGEAGPQADRHRSQDAMSLAKDCVIFPTVDAPSCLAGATGRRASRRWPVGQGIAVVGIDGKIRGFNRRNIRPDLAIVDDIDDREMPAASPRRRPRDCHRAGHCRLWPAAGSACARVMLCTVINRRASRPSTPLKPRGAGQRFKMLVKLPERRICGREYIELRRNRAVDDPTRGPRTASTWRTAPTMDRGGDGEQPHAFESKPGPRTASRSKSRRFRPATTRSRTWLGCVLLRIPERFTAAG